MKKVGLLVVVIVILCVIGLPPVLGTIGQSQVEQRIETINANDVLRIDVLGYERSWFTSTARMEVGLSDTYTAQMQGLSDVDGPVLELVTGRKLTVVADIAHGPVALSDGMQLGFWHLLARPDQQAADNVELQQTLGMTELFEFRGRTGFTGTLHFALAVPAIDYASDVSTFNTSPLILDGSYRSGRIVTDAGLDSLFYSAGPIGIAISGVEAEGDNEFLSRNIMLGTAGMTMDRVTIVNEFDPAMPLFDANGIALTSDVEVYEDGSLLRGTVDYSFADADAGQYQITDGQMRVSAENLDVVAMQDYYDRISALPADPEDPQAALDQVLPIIGRLLEAQPTVTFDPVRLSVNGESFNAGIRIDTDASRMPPAGAMVFDDPTLWAGIVSVDADLRASKPLAELLAAQVVRAQLGVEGLPPDQVDQMVRAQAGFLLVTLSGQGMLVDQGDSYSATIEFRDGVLLLNGNPLPIGF